MLFAHANSAAGTFLLRSCAKQAKQAMSSHPAQGIDPCLLERGFVQVAGAVLRAAELQEAGRFGDSLGKSIATSPAECGFANH